MINFPKNNRFSENHKFSENNKFSKILFFLSEPIGRQLRQQLALYERHCGFLVFLQVNVQF
jgi:hypothetical protein